MIIAIVALIYGGWKSWPWWAPAAATGLLIPATALKALMVNDWRAQAGLHEITSADFAVSIAINFAVLCAVFLAARGTRLLARRVRGSQKP